MSPENAKKRGRPKTDTSKVYPTLTAAQHRDLEHLMLVGYGNSKAEVAAYLICRELDDLRRSGVLPNVANVPSSSG